MARDDELCISYAGWGYYTIPIKVIFDPALNKEPVTFNHELVFEGVGGWSTKLITFSKK